MRRSTFILVFVLVAFAAQRIVWAIFKAAEISLPFWQALVLWLVVCFVLGLVITLVLNPFNRWLLEWRKARGRDIEDEERYESEHGMIKLTPNEAPTEKE